MVDFILFHYKDFLSILTIWTLAVLMPGPDLFLIIRSAILQSKLQALSAVSGIIIGTLIWLIVGFFLINFLNKTSLFNLLQFLGGTYLLYMAINILLSLKNKKTQEEFDTKKTYHSPTRGFLLGLFTNLSNPKPPIFISIILSKLPNTTPLSADLLLLLIMLFIPSIWFYFVVHFFRKEIIFKTFFKYNKWIDCMAGGIFALFGINLVFNGFSTLY